MRGNSDDRKPIDSPRSERWEVSRIDIFRAVGYAFGLPAFISGTAFFMLGFSLERPYVLRVGCILYSVASLGIGGRVILDYKRPTTGLAAVCVAFVIILAACSVYCVLVAIFLIFGIDLY